MLLYRLQYILVWLQTFLIDILKEMYLVLMSLSVSKNLNTNEEYGFVTTNTIFVLDNRIFL